MNQKRLKKVLHKSYHRRIDSLARIHHWTFQANKGALDMVHDKEHQACQKYVVTSPDDPELLLRHLRISHGWGLERIEKAQGITVLNGYHRSMHSKQLTADDKLVESLRTPRKSFADGMLYKREQRDS